jgi:hypothetical protein
MNLKAAKARQGRSLGWSARELETLPYARFWNPQMADLSSVALQAVANSPVAESLMAPMDQAVRAIEDAEVQSGWTITSAGAAHVNLLTELPGVTPEMVDWWFGWHSDSPERYKLWHPRAHVHAEWQRTPPAGSHGRSRYVGSTSVVDEYLGSTLGRFAISFRPPEEFGLRDARVEAGVEATAVCARVGLVDVPVDAGYLLHLVTRTDGGSVMRSRFWIGLPYTTPRAAPLRAVLPLARSLIRPTVDETRALLVHCAQEMAHLATFLPELYAQEAQAQRVSR